MAPNRFRKDAPGKWIAWTKDRTSIVAHGTSFAEVRGEAIATGCKDPLMQHVLGTSFVMSDYDSCFRRSAIVLCQAIVVD